MGSTESSKPKQNGYVLIGAIVVIILVVVGIAGVYILNRPSTSSSASNSTTSGSANVIQVVAAENFWGSLASQLGGVHTNVTSIVSDPNTDPHEYEANPANAIAITNAKFIIVNGAGYDTWALDILSSENTPNQVVLNVQQLLGQPVDANPHFWYRSLYVNITVHAMYEDLIKIDPTDSSYFQSNYANLNSSLWSSYMSREAYINQQYAGTPVASTESIFVYMANSTGLKVISPAAFMEAVAEGNDPPEASVAEFETEIMGGNSTIHVLVYNEQTVTPLTQQIKALAAQYQIPIIGVTETIQPPNETFQFWMGSEVANLQNALNAAALGE
ncbi:MAG TPA: zinc ABC transporter substrate-binding protein [Nitrososphaerales archaeon]|nr:zinc ABC transporter substrate-binding protein [Nitrososphaerales archaeon]